MAKRYLGGGVSFEQKDVYQEFSEDEGGGGGSTTLSGLTDVDISSPTDGQTLVYNATTGKWENGAGGGGGVHSIGVQTVEDKTALTVTAGELFGWLQNGEYVVLHTNQSENEGVFHPVSEYDFTAADGYGFVFGNMGFVAGNADDYPVGVA